MFSKLFKKKVAPSGLRFYEDPETSCFKEWFNTNHKLSDHGDKQTFHKFAFDLSVYWLADYEPLNSLHEEISAQEKKKRNEIATYEIGCWYLSYLDDWLVSNDHKDRDFIMSSMIHNFAKIPTGSFQINLEDLRRQVVSRLTYYQTKEDLKDIATTISIQIVTGCGKGMPTQSIPPEQYNMLDIYIGRETPRIMAWIDDNSKMFRDNWEKIFLNPACLK